MAVACLERPIGLQRVEPALLWAPSKAPAILFHCLTTAYGNCSRIWESTATIHQVVVDVVAILATFFARHIAHGVKAHASVVDSNSILAPQKLEIARTVVAPVIAISTGVAAIVSKTTVLGIDGSAACGNQQNRSEHDHRISFENRHYLPSILEAEKIQPKVVFCKSGAEFRELQDRKRAEMRAGELPGRRQRECRDQRVSHGHRPFQSGYGRSLGGCRPLTEARRRPALMCSFARRPVHAEIREKQDDLQNVQSISSRIHSVGDLGNRGACARAATP